MHSISMGYCRFWRCCCATKCEWLYCIVFTVLSTPYWHTASSLSLFARVLLVSSFVPSIFFLFTYYPSAWYAHDGHIHMHICILYIVVPGIVARSHLKLRTVGFTKRSGERGICRTQRGSDEKWRLTQWSSCEMKIEVDQTYYAHKKGEEMGDWSWLFNTFSGEKYWIHMESNGILHNSFSPN